MLTKISTGNVVRSQLKMLLTIMFAIQPQHRKLIVPALVRTRAGAPIRRTYVEINEEL